MDQNCNERLQELLKIIENYHELPKQQQKMLNDSISRFANRGDQYFCSDCFRYGAPDNENMILCGGSSCNRAYCEKCLNKRNEICKCGTNLEE